MTPVEHTPPLPTSPVAPTSSQQQSVIPVWLYPLFPAPPHHHWPYHVTPPPVSPSRAGTPYLAWETLSWLIVWHGFFGFIHSPSLLRYHFHNVCQGNRHPGSFQSVSDSSRHLDSQAPPPVPVPKRTVIGSVMPKQFRPTRVWVKGGLGTGKALES
jgi:hypothetical protein